MSPHSEEGRTTSSADIPAGSLDDAAEAALVASRALLGVVARSLSDALDTVTLPQFRVLVVLRTGGAQRIGALAEQMDANVSTFSRFLDRMVEGGWVSRHQGTQSRREVVADITPQGRRLVDAVTRRRRQELADILATLSDADRAAMQRGLEAFARAAGEPPARDLLTLGL